MNQRDLLNREIGHKPKRTINKPKGIKPGWRQRGNLVYPHRLPNNHLGNSGKQMNLVKAIGGVFFYLIISNGSKLTLY